MMGILPDISHKNGIKWSDSVGARRFSSLTNSANDCKDKTSSKGTFNPVSEHFFRDSLKVKSMKFHKSGKTF
jgi:hypothetical protein